MNPHSVQCFIDVKCVPDIYMWMENVEVVSFFLILSGSFTAHNNLFEFISHYFITDMKNIWFKQNITFLYVLGMYNRFVKPIKTKGPILITQEQQ